MLSRNQEEKLKISHGERRFQMFKFETFQQFTRKATRLADFQVWNQKSFKKSAQSEIRVGNKHLASVCFSSQARKSRKESGKFTFSSCLFVVF